jgi:hypothetical protein
VLEGPERQGLFSSRHDDPRRENTPSHLNPNWQDEGRLGISMFNSDLDFGDSVTFTVFILLATCAVIAILILGLKLFYSWEGEWLMRCSSQPFSSSLTGLFG